MRLKRGLDHGLVLLGCLVAISLLCHRSSAALPVPNSNSGVRLDGSFGKLPLYFIENRGQADPRVAYYVQGRGTTLYLTSQGLTFVLAESASPSKDPRIDRVSFPPRPIGAERDEPGRSRRWVVKLDFVGANPEMTPEGQDPTPAVISYFKGAREQCQTGLRTYGTVVYRDLWPGIDLVYTGTVNRLKYNFLVKPGADPERIRLAYSGVSSLSVTDTGQLQVTTPVAGFQDDRPVAYQEVEGRLVEVGTSYAVKAGERDASWIYGFKVGDYDRSKLLILDPAVLVYCGYIGGLEPDGGSGIAADGSGNAYVAGYAESAEGRGFPEYVGPDLTHNGGTDAFVAKVNALGALVYCGYIGGSGDDWGKGIAVDSAGNAYVTGLTLSTETSFPVVEGPDLTHNGGADAFVAKVNPTGTALVYCGYIGGSGGDDGLGIAVDSASGLAYVTGYTTSTQASFPVTGGPDLTHNGDVDAFVAIVHGWGGGLALCGYIGGSDRDIGEGIAVDNDGSAYVTGWTGSAATSFPVVAGPDLTYNGGYDAFVAKVVPSTKSLAYCGYIGGVDDDLAYGIAVDHSGNAYVAGVTRVDRGAESTFPVTVGPDLTQNGGTQDAFVAKVNPTGTGLVYCGYIGGSGQDEGRGIAVDSSGNAYITGLTYSTESSFPVTGGPDLTFNGGNDDAFVAKVNPTGTGLVYCGYIGGSYPDEGYSIAVDSGGNVYITGETFSPETSFPVKGGPDLTHNGYYDAFVAKVVVDGGFYVIPKRTGGASVIYLE